MITSADVVAEARRWENTPFHWQASRRGRGCDCKGLILGVARELRIPGYDNAQAIVANYRLIVDAHQLRAGLEANMIRVSDIMPGTVILVILAGKAQHMGIATYDGRMIHALEKGPKCVREVPIGSRAIDSVWAFRGVRY